MERGEEPDVRCTGCDRRAACIRVSDGTVYRPLAWAYPDPQKPLEGICAGCQALTKATIAEALCGAGAGDHEVDERAGRVSVVVTLPRWIGIELP